MNPPDDLFEFVSGKVFYRLINPENNHFGFTYNLTGFNRLDEELDEKTKNGLYCTSKENIHECLRFGTVIYEVRFPDKKNYPDFNIKFNSRLFENTYYELRSNMMILGKSYKVDDPKTIAFFGLKDKNLAEWAATHGNIEMLNILKNKNFAFNIRALKVYAAHSEKPEVLEWISENFSSSTAQKI